MQFETHKPEVMNAAVRLPMQLCLAPVGIDRAPADNHTWVLVAGASLLIVALCSILGQADGRECEASVYTVLALDVGIAVRGRQSPFIGPAVSVEVETQVGVSVDGDHPRPDLCPAPPILSNAVS